MATYATAVSRERFTMNDLLDTNIEATHGPKAFILSEEGVGFYIDSQSGSIHWSQNYFGGRTYNMYKSPEADTYIDLIEGIDNKSAVCHFRKNSSPTSLPMPADADKEREMRSGLGVIFGKLPRIWKYEKVYNVDPLSGSKVGRGSANSLEITRADWYIEGKAFEKTLNLHFVVLSISRGTAICCHRAESFLRRCNQLKLHDVPGQTYLIRAVNRSKMIRIVNPLIELSKGRGNTLYLAGRLRGKDVFVRQVPVDEDVSKLKKIINLHNTCSHIANVLSLEWVECDDRFVYLAFERVRGPLKGYVDDLLVSRIDDCDTAILQLLRNVVLGLLQVHCNGFYHGNVAVENILVRRGPGNRDLIKLCGFGNSQSFDMSERDNTMGSYAYLNQNYQLATTMLKILPPSRTRKYDARYEQQLADEGYGAEVIQSLISVGYEAADLCRRLLHPDPNSGWDLLMTYNHIVFMDPSTKLDLLCDVSAHLQKVEGKGVQARSHNVFGTEWKTRLNCDSLLSRMEEKSMHDRNHKEKAYSKYSLRDLIKLLRNLREHSDDFEPAQSDRSFVEFISSRFPRLFPEIYDHVIVNWKHTELYNKYHKQETELI